MATRIYDGDQLAKLLETQLSTEQFAQVAKLAPDAAVPAFCRSVLNKFEAQPEVWTAAFALVKKRHAQLG